MVCHSVKIYDFFYCLDFVSLFGTFEPLLYQNLRKNLQITNCEFLKLSIFKFKFTENIRGRNFLRFPHWWYITTSQNAEVEYHYVILVSGTLKALCTKKYTSTYVAYISTYVIDCYKIIHRNFMSLNFALQGLICLLSNHAHSHWWWRRLQFTVLYDLRSPFFPLCLWLCHHFLNKFEQ